MSERHACAVLNLSRSVYRYQAKPSDNEELREQLLSLAGWKPRWGCRKMYAYLKNQGQHWNHKRVRRIYRALGLNLRVKPKKRLAVRDPQPLVAPTEANRSWSLDFMHDSLATQSRTDCIVMGPGSHSEVRTALCGNARTIRTLNIIPTQFVSRCSLPVTVRYWVDDFNREALWLEVDTSIPATRVVRVLNMRVLSRDPGHGTGWRGYPQQLRLDPVQDTLDCAMDRN